jgi:2-polyprenyl-3-methyl-5-hydroxy-6-metoxy-1,4-benzoquinol methylase
MSPEGTLRFGHSLEVSEDRRDIWAEWLAERRSGGDPELRRRMLEKLAGVRDKVLNRAGLAEGETLLDVGCGEGVIGFRCARSRGWPRRLLRDLGGPARVLPGNR